MKAISRRTFLAGVGAGLGAASLAALGASEAGDGERLVFVGVFTSRSGSSSKGIYLYRWNPRTGTLTARGLAAETSNPSFLALSPDRRRLYAVNEINQYQGAASGSVSAFLLDPGSGKLKLANVVTSGGAGPCNITVDRTGGAVFVADYAGGSLASYRVLAGGKLSDPVSNFHFQGHSVVQSRQAAAHTHCVTVAPGNRFLLVNDLGMDRIMVFHIELPTARLTANDPPFYAAIPGSGPRSIVFHPNGRWVYSTNEVGNTIDMLDWDGERGVLTRRQNLSTLPGGFAGTSTAAMSVLDPRARFLYVSNRGADNIVVFPLNPKDGSLGGAQQEISCGGKTPRYIALDPTGRWLLAGNQGSANIAIFARDAASGRLSPHGESKLDAPVCILFV